MRKGSDITLVGWGAQLAIMEEACDEVSKFEGISCELIDLRTLIPWDKELVEDSVNKTGRLLVNHKLNRHAYCDSNLILVACQLCRIIGFLSSLET